MKKYILTLAITIVSLASLSLFAHAQEYTFSRDLFAGVSGDDVTALQSWLISSGYDIPAISSNSAMKGYFGSQTRNALMKYQLSIGLPNTGYFGPLTRGRIHDGYRGNSLVVTSPNGGEVWQKGTVRNITWNSTIKQTADIKLAFPLPACAKPGANPMCMVKMRAPYTIAKGVSLSAGTYSWNVGSFIFDPATVPYCSNVSTTGDCINPPSLVDDGQYTVQICPTNGSECDESNGEFTITSGEVSSKTPVINGIDAPTTLVMNQAGTWTIRATDPQNSSLSYSVDWGDVQDIYANLPSGSTAEPFPFVQNTTFTHSYVVPGTYTVRFKVKNSAGLTAQSSVTVKVTSPSVGGPLRITSPNGNETWVKGTQQNITWTAPAYFRATYADIRLVGYNPPCPVSPNSDACPTMPALMPVVLAKNISINQNSYNWKVGDYIPEVMTMIYPPVYPTVPNGQYYVQICEAGTTNCDSSDQSFTITSPTLPSTVKVTSPNGGEVWQASSTHQIAWYVNGAIDTNTKLDLYLDKWDPCPSSNGMGCTSPLFILDKSIPISMIYNWIVATDINNSAIPAGNYKVRICTAGSTTNCDTSDSSFKISQ